MNIVAVIVGLIGGCLLLAAAIIDFVLSTDQKNTTNTNSLIAAGIMTLLAVIFIIVFTYSIV